MSVDTHPPAAGVPTAHTFDEFVERYLNYLRSVDYAPSTLRKKRRVIAAFAQWIRSEKPVMTVLKDQDIEVFSSLVPRRTLQAAVRTAHFDASVQVSSHAN
ncbi:hypothetical protein PQR75_42210 [Paraburkholderia fungorum]|uniref:hypothetical protein n=1 Tax=Paraburkholderia fungorum TaxID=134537 RepID=UPI0038BC4ABE